jgi:hypothetical protein
MNFYFQLVLTFIFLVSHNNCLNKSFRSSYISLKNFMVPGLMIKLPHLRSSNVCHSGMVETTGLKVGLRRYLQWHDLTGECNANQPNGSQDISGGHTDRQRDRLVTS